MASLRQLINQHSSLLLLDAASNRIQVGLLTEDESSRWATSDHEAGRGIFECVEQLGINPTSVSALVFCSGPGSILGIRTTAMAVRAWNVLNSRPTYEYGSLNLVAHALNQPELKIIADARRERWHCQVVRQPLRQMDAANLEGEILLPEGFRHWSPLPDHVNQTSYELRTLLPRISDADIFSETDNPDAFLHIEPTYKEWTPQIHRTP